MTKQSIHWAGQDDAGVDIYRVSGGDPYCLTKASLTYVKATLQREGPPDLVDETGQAWRRVVVVDDMGIYRAHRIRI